MKKTQILSLGLLPISLLLVSCQDTPTTISTSVPSFARMAGAGGPTNIDAFDMNDRFSGSGAKGSGTARVTDGQINLTIHARDLEANHPYEVHLIVGPEGNPMLDLDNLTDVHVFPVSSDRRGRLEFKIVGFDLGLDPGQYRLDYVVVHDHPTVDFPGNLVLACAPASFVTI